ncbi:MAG: GxxExxY protein [Patescibacteria group bacterium]|nr:GxxExxY protein [Patescibacteria group bacterium]
MPEKILHKDLSYKVCGFCFKAHNELGRFRNERSYGDRLERLFSSSGVSFEREKSLPVSFDGEKPGRNIPDFIIDGKLILDIKAKRMIEKADYYQMKRYLAASKLRLGLIVNFRQKYLSPKRVLGQARIL